MRTQVILLSLMLFLLLGYVAFFAIVFNNLSKEIKTSNSVCTYCDLTKK